jgi:prepilin-type N-terminal cleavage/methylation domain-containing protein
MNKKGFTLLELAIVLAIAGVLSVAAFKIMTGVFSDTKQTSTKNSILAIVKEVSAYTVRAKRLPLNLSDAVTTTSDSFGRTFFYKDADNAGLANDICSVNTANIAVEVCADAACTSIKMQENNIAFIIISNGEDGTQQYTESTANGVTTYRFFDNGVNVNGAPFDDIVGWMNLNTLKSMVGCDGSLGIVQEKLPNAIVQNSYDFTLSPKSGTADYDWCIESDNDTIVQENFFYNTTATGGNSIRPIGGCAATYFIKSNNIIHIHTNGSALTKEKNDKNIDDASANSALIIVNLRDSNNITVSKRYQLRILRPFEVAIGATKVTYDPNATDGFSNFKSNNIIGYDANNKPIYEAVNNTNTNPSAIIKSDELQIVQNNGNATTSVFTDCNPNQASAKPCPKFQNHGIFSAYFIYDFTSDPLDQWGKPNYRDIFGFTFAVIKSYKPGTEPTDESSTTMGLTGDSGPGIGYGDNGWIDGINGGNSFALEFDLHKDDFQQDPDDDHLAIVSRIDARTNWNTPFTVSYYDTDTAKTFTLYNKEKNTNGTYKQNYESYAQNVHDVTVKDEPDHYWSHNDQYHSYDKKSKSYTELIKSKETGKGLYFDSTSAVIPNNFNVANPVRYGIRIEAVSGCNYKCTVCDGQTERDNYIFINVWRNSESTINSTETIKTDMQDVKTSLTYDKVMKGKTHSLGNPLMSECIPDDTSTNRTLDTIRFGFTSGKWGYSYDNFIKFYIRDFKAYVRQYSLNP